MTQINLVLRAGVIKNKADKRRGDDGAIPRC